MEQEEPTSQNNLENVRQESPPLWQTGEERLLVCMIQELAGRFGLRRPREVAAVLKVSHREAERLLALAAEND